MEIIELQVQEIGAIQQLWERLNATHYENSTWWKDHFKGQTFNKRMKGLIQLDKCAVFAAKDQADLVAYCIVSIKQSIGEIDSIFVNDEIRQTGVGQMLLQKAMNWVKGHGIEQIKVGIAEGNESVLTFYAKMGFQKHMTVLKAII